MTTTAYRFTLERGSKKHPCPECRQKTFVRYVDNETGEHLAEDCGRCDRENRCGYHKKPKELFEQTGRTFEPIHREPVTVIVPDTYDIHPATYVEQSMRAYKETNFAACMYRLFGADMADNALLSYFTGYSKHYNGKACIFWQIDHTGEIRGGKIMQYNPETFKRVKDFPGVPAVDWVHYREKKATGKEFKQRQCFFGEHILTEDPGKPVYIFESEKTAVICSLYFPDAVCLATGGSAATQLRHYNMFKVLQGRNVLLFPDYGLTSRKDDNGERMTCFAVWQELANDIADRAGCSVKVSRILEDNLTEDQRPEGADLADFIVKTDETGRAIFTPGYPVAFDYKRSSKEIKSILQTYEKR